MSAACVGGYWLRGWYTGPCYWHCYDAPSVGGVTARARLSYIKPNAGKLFPLYFGGTACRARGAGRRQLEQRLERRAVLLELQQRPVEYERQQPRASILYCLSNFPCTLYSLPLGKNQSLRSGQVNH